MTKPKNKQENKETQNRPPVVVILGHVDHGKTSILDYIRKTKVAEKETGGITQHIGAYQIEHQDKTITFIDTPGHEAFSAMRSRGANVADIAVLVIAAEESIKPQTKEAINHIKKIGIPVIVVINKIDKPEAQPDKIKSELMEQGLIVEDRGGDVPCINVSAKTGKGIDELLEMINLVAEMEELEDASNQPTKGIIIESYQDAQQGPTATLLVKQGVLKIKDIVGTNSAFGRIKSMRDFQLQPIEQALASTPVIVVGFNQVPQVGEEFSVFDDMEQAENKVEKEALKSAPEDEQVEVIEISPDQKVFNLILKADVYGSLEALRESLKNIPSDEVIIRFLNAEVGDVNESDVKLAESAKARLIGFRVKINPSAKEAARNKKIPIETFEIIYELIQRVRELMSGLLEPEIIRQDLGQLKILAIFKTDGNRQIVGGRVTFGNVQKNALVEIIRNKEIIGQGKLTQLQRDKKETDEVAKDQECGMMIESPTIIEKGDTLKFYLEEKKKREI